MDTYPRDEFDDLVPPTDGRRGAHRAAPSKLLGIVPLALVAAAVAAVVVGTTTLLPDSEATAAAGASASSGAQTAAPEAAAPPASDTAAATQASASGAAEGAEEDAAAGEPEESAAPVDKAVPLVVLNSTGTKGLAASAAAALGEDGWSVERTDNYREGVLETSTVKYPSEELEATAAQLAADLGAGATTELDAEVAGVDGEGTVVVVVGGGYPG